MIKSFWFQNNIKTIFGFFFYKKHCNTCCFHESGYVFQPKSTFVDLESFFYSGFSIVVMERRIQDDVFPLFICVNGPVIQVFLFPGLFVGISIEKPEKLAGFFSIEYIYSFFLKIENSGAVLKFIVFFITWYNHVYVFKITY